jgi:hypothetical protein
MRHSGKPPNALTSMRSVVCLFSQTQLYQKIINSVWHSGFIAHLCLSQERNGHNHEEEKENCVGIGWITHHRFCRGHICPFLTQREKGCSIGARVSYQQI